MTSQQTGPQGTKEEIWLAALEQVTQALDHEGVSHFLDTGTLLGAVRDGRFIPWDNDIDIGIVDCLCDDARLLRLVGKLSSTGFVANLSTTGVGLFSPQGVEINLKLYRRDGEVLVGDYSYFSHASAFRTFLYNVAAGHQKGSFGSMPIFRIKAVLIALRPIWGWLALPWLQSGISHKALVARVKTADVCPMSTIAFYGSTFWVPARAAAYLAHRYGPEWGTPIRDYDYTRDDQSIATRAAQ